MKQLFAHSGAWGLALIMIVVASWFLYRYLAPKSWREWASAGLVRRSSSPSMRRCMGSRSRFTGDNFLD